MWALLDIRTGRANRAQFFVLAVISRLAIDFVMVIPQDEVRIFCSFFFLYLFILMLVRRFRDTDVSLASMGSVAKIGLGIVAGMAAILGLIYYLSDANWAYLVITGYALSPLFILSVTGTLLLLICPLLIAGIPDETQYGLPPVGLDFRTMTPQTYPARTAERFRASQKAQTKTKEHTDHIVTNQYEFKGREK
jgi:hypothetical protein